MNIYVGNLSWDSTEDSLRSAFTEYGDVSSANIIVDKYTGRSRGFGFVEMPDADNATAAINALNGKDLDGRTLTVNEARPRNNDRGGQNRNRSDW